MSENVHRNQDNLLTHKGQTFSFEQILQGSAAPAPQPAVLPPVMKALAESRDGKDHESTAVRPNNFGTQLLVARPARCLAFIDNELLRFAPNRLHDAIRYCIREYLTDPTAKWNHTLPARESEDLILSIVTWIVTRAKKLHTDATYFALDLFQTVWCMYTTSGELPANPLSWLPAHELTVDDFDYEIEHWTEPVPEWLSGPAIAYTPECLNCKVHLLTLESYEAGEQ